MRERERERERERARERESEMLIRFDMCCVMHLTQAIRPQFYWTFGNRVRLLSPSLELFLDSIVNRFASIIAKTVCGVWEWQCTGIHAQCLIHYIIFLFFAQSVSLILRARETMSIECRLGLIFSLFSLYLCIYWSENCSHEVHPAIWGSGL